MRGSTEGRTPVGPAGGAGRCSLQPASNSKEGRAAPHCGPLKGPPAVWILPAGHEQPLLDPGDILTCQPAPEGPLLAAQTAQPKTQALGLEVKTQKTTTETWAEGTRCRRSSRSEFSTAIT